MPRAAHLFFGHRLLGAAEHAAHHAGMQVELTHTVAIRRRRRLVLEHEQPHVVTAESIGLVIALQIEDLWRRLRGCVCDNDAGALTADPVRFCQGYLPTV